MEFDVDTHNVTVLVEHGRSYVYAMDYDYTNRFIYFPRYMDKDIVRYVNVYYNDVKSREISNNITYKVKHQSYQL